MTKHPGKTYFEVHNRWTVVLLMTVASLACGCDSEPPAAPPPPTKADLVDQICAGEARTLDAAEEQAPEVSCPDNGAESWLCLGGWAAHCLPSGELASLDNCLANNQVCSSRQCRGGECIGGCLACEPGSVACGDDGELNRCTGDGTTFELETTCDEQSGLRCSVRGGQCEDLCAAAAERESYIGCEYWAVPTLNSFIAAVADENGERLLEPLVQEGFQTPSQRLCNVFKFALVITNSEGVPAHVSIENPSEPARSLTIAPGTVETIEIPCQPEGVAPDAINPAFMLMGPVDAETMPSRRSREAAFHVTSDVPITVYQFNPLEFSQEVNGNSVNSYSNDASLLLPVHSLTGNYTVMSRPTWSVEERFVDMSLDPMTAHFPGFLTVTATAPGETVVRIEASAHTRASDDGSLPALAPGDNASVTLAQGETLQVVTASPSKCVGEPDALSGGIATTFCHVGDSYDLTGTRIRADKPVSVIGGHDCTFVPRNLAACDHLEEAIFPEDALGLSALVTVAEAVTCDHDIPTIIRVVSTADDNRIEFSPDVHEPTVLQRGELLEFEALEDFEVRAQGPIMVGQFLVGQQFDGGNRERSTERGDPAFSVISPIEQWRDDYAFLVPETLPDSFVNIVARADQSVRLDGRTLMGMAPIGDTGFFATRVAVGPGSHHVTSRSTFGITVYGYASFTSYMIPGGLDLYPINRPD